MEIKNANDDNEAIRRLISGVSEAWLAGDASRLNQYFHGRMTINGPDLQELGAGREACVKSYEDFIRETAILEYEESEPKINLYGSTAVVVCLWKITYEMKGQKHRDEGRDLLVLVRHEGSWLVAWRAVFPQSGS
jgi:ketosteroid isomerase-like protein